MDDSFSALNSETLKGTWRREGSQLKRGSNQLHLTALHNFILNVCSWSVQLPKKNVQWDSGDLKKVII